MSDMTLSSGSSKEVVGGGRVDERNQGKDGGEAKEGTLKGT